MDIAAARREALDRSLLLFADLLDTTVSADQLDEHLAGFRVRITAAEADRVTQTAVTTIAALLVRSGMPVVVDMPDRPTLTPLLRGGPFLASLDTHLRQAMPGASLESDGRADLTIALGSVSVAGGDAVWIGAGPTAARCTSTVTAWRPGGELEAIAGAALAATEAHKAALRPLPARHRTAQRLLQSSSSTYEVGIGMSVAPDVGPLTMVSAGAITNAALWTLIAIPNMSGHIRVWDSDRVALSNLNRCLLFGLMSINEPKVDALRGWSRRPLFIEPIPKNFRRGDRVETMALVGADRVGARHDVQLARPPLLVVGATEGAGVVLVSEHGAGDPCAACLHPHGATEEGRVPTASFVSFWAGYLAAVRVLRAIGAGSRDSRQVTRCYPLQPQATVEGPATRRPDCEVCGAGELTSA
ncbi:MAG: hypothetical protein ACRDG7_10910 [Candidatus Limnocylindria bacterium]